MIERKDREKFVDVFVAKNTQLNLSAIRDADGVFLKHVQDALELNEIWSFTKGENVIDVGTGGGIPLLPLAISNPDVHFVWLDSVKKKTVAIADMAETLWLANVDVVWSRAEDHKQKYDALTARAMAYIDDLMWRCYSLVKKSGHFILYKMWSEEEESAIDAVCERYKLAFEKQHMYKLFDEDIQRVIYVLRKL